MEKVRTYSSEMVGIGPLALLLILVVLACYGTMADRGLLGPGGFAIIATAGVTWTGDEFRRSLNESKTLCFPAYFAAIGHVVVLLIAVLTLATA
ncbi:hypothetical protein [Paraburkholderia sp. J11-2]|uniref:hypothetical protein n=1 Tax=Paraburkholderia sp. J11-2 TaxID=2805431 RepID=UPI002AB6E258|nr:hypothetical protein [Paraburkholderia sp. J11-2]